MTLVHLFRQKFDGKDDLISGLHNSFGRSNGKPVGIKVFTDRVRSFEILSTDSTGYSQLAGSSFAVFDHNVGKAGRIKIKGNRTVRQAG